MTMIDSRNDSVVDKAENNPKDSVQCVRWKPGEKSTSFAVGGWDFKLRIYEVTAGQGSKPRIDLKGMLDMQAPVLAIEWLERENILIVGLGNCEIVAVSMNGEKKTIGKAEFPICDIRYYDDRDKSCLLIFLLNDTVLLQSLSGSGSFPTESTKLNYNIICVDIQGSVVVLGLSNSKILITDVNNLFNKNHSYVDSGLQSKISTISLKNSKDKIGIGSVDGRITILSIETSSYSRSNYSTNNDIVFRAHKYPENTTASNQSLFYISSVNFLYSYSGKQNILLSCGTNGLIKLWNRDKKEEAYTIQVKDKDISIAKFNPDGTLLFYATGYSWCKGVWGLNDINYAPEIFVHEVDHRKF